MNPPSEAHTMLKFVNASVGMVVVVCKSCQESQDNGRCGVGCRSAQWVTYSKRFHLTGAVTVSNEANFGALRSIEYNVDGKIFLSKKIKWEFVWITDGTRSQPSVPWHDDFIRAMQIKHRKGNVGLWSSSLTFGLHHGISWDGNWINTLVFSYTLHHSSRMPELIKENVSLCTIQNSPRFQNHALH